MSCIICIDVHLEVFVSFTYQLKYNCSILLLIAILAHQEIVDNWLGGGPVDRHIDDYFISQLPFFLNFNGKTR